MRDLPERFLNLNLVREILIVGVSGESATLLWKDQSNSLISHLSKAIQFIILFCFLNKNTGWSWNGLYAIYSQRIGYVPLRLYLHIFHVFYGPKNIETFRILIGSLFSLSVLIRLWAQCSLLNEKNVDSQKRFWGDFVNQCDVSQCLYKCGV